VWGYGVDTPQARSFTKAWRDANAGAEPGLYVVSGYLELRTILEALAKAGPDRARIKAALETISWESPIGTIRFDQNHQAHTLMFVTRNEGGKGIVIRTYDTSKE
jgi:branched-chain amino acid transport system substrate-binding protein